LNEGTEVNKDTMQQKWWRNDNNLDRVRKNCIFRPSHSLKVQTSGWYWSYTCNTTPTGEVGL